MTISNIAKVVQWDAAKGFGFAEANGIRYFVHITALGHTSRPPKVGDTITVEIFGKNEKGPRIEKGHLEGVEIVDYYASNRGTKRLVYASGCKIYYTGDHYRTFSKIEF